MLCSIYTMTHAPVGERTTSHKKRDMCYIAVSFEIESGDGGPSHQGDVRISAGMSVSIDGEGVRFRSKPKSSVLFAGFERKASIPEFKQSCFVDSWQSALNAMT